MRVLDGSEVRPGELYGKVLKSDVRPDVIYVRLTSVPPELRPLLDAAFNQGPATAPIVTESVLGSS
jgi:hypothetical protein